MKLKMPLPAGRSYEQVLNHYKVEKAIAEKLKKASREERKLIYATMYDELFRQVPDHPRLTRRENEASTLKANRSKFALIKGFLDKSVIFAEFAPGDCKFAMEVSRRVKRAYGIDISDQRSPKDLAPDNFTLIVYNGYDLEGIPDNSIDVIFSDQFIEHLHPEDAKLHFRLAYRLLKKGGKYVFRTPHSFTGPRDISKYFSDKPEGFHLKEWTYTELWEMLKELDFSRIYSFANLKACAFRIPYVFFHITEKLGAAIPKRYAKPFSRYLFPSIRCVAVK